MGIVNNVESCVIRRKRALWLAGIFTGGPIFHYLSRTLVRGEL